MMTWIWMTIGCVHWSPNTPLRHDLQIQRLCDGTVAMDSGKLHISKANYDAVPIREGELRIVTQAYGIDEQGALWYNDALYGDTVQHQSDCKLDLSAVETEAIGGQLKSKWTVTPYHNVLETLDSGIERMEMERFKRKHSICPFI